jgi:hypothetical protein
MFMDAIKLMDHKKINKPGADKIDHLINKIFSADNHSFKNIEDHKIKTGQKKWIIPEEPQGFI